MNLIGKLHEKFETQNISATFRKREFVVEYADNPMYPQYIKFQLVQDKCELLDQFEPGTMMDISFNLRGRSWVNPEGQTKYFNSIDAWRLSPAVTQQPVQQMPQQQPMPQAQTTTPQTPASQGMVDVTAEDDDLPF